MNETLHRKQKSRLNREEKSWIAYDWANSAHSAIISAMILPVFYKSITNGILEPYLANAYWGYATSAATAVIALLAPLLGTLGDYRGNKMKFFRRFFLLGAISTAAIAFVHGWQGLLAAYMITMIGFSGANLYYDAFLVDVTSNERMDKVSTYGYALGYVGGGTIPLIISVFFIFYGENLFGIPAEISTRGAFLLAALWWGIFTVPMLKNVRQVYWMEPVKHPVRTSVKRLAGTFRNIRNYRELFLFLLAYLFYIDGVNTIIHIATIYGESMGFGTRTVLIILMGTQALAFPCAILYGKLAERFGSRTMLLAGISIYSMVCILSFVMALDFLGMQTRILLFWIIGFLVSTSQGGIQAISRSYFGKMVPKPEANEFFGFYNIVGKFAALTGPALFGFFGHITGRSEYGILSILLLFAAGGVLFILSSRKEPPEKQFIP
ncbi:MAG TPA: MFS transporter, partial [Clostridiales bacterium]|nr:MFS transporter [Clostridiales bacterium]